MWNGSRNKINQLIEHRIFLVDHGMPDIIIHINNENDVWTVELDAKSFEYDVKSNQNDGHNYYM